jgi:hypothetical protein
MDRKKISVAVTSVAVTFLAITCVTASFQTTNTPLYTVRMEQASSKMNFLPTEMNEFTYITEKEYNLDYCITGRCNSHGGGDVTPLLPYTCSTCDEYYCEEPTHCGTCVTCYSTCQSSCGGTCSTCTGLTCEGTCYPTECDWTQWIDCDYTLVFPTCYWPNC